MPQYRGFTISFNAIGSGKVLRKYLVLACKDMLVPLLSVSNRNMIEAKCSCQITLNTAAVFRKSVSGNWIKYQLLQVVAPSQAKHLQAKRLLEGLMPGCTVLEEYKNTASSRLQCNEFVPDNKKLVFSYHRNGITHYKYGEMENLSTPGKPPTPEELAARPWKITQREKMGISLPIQVFPLQRKLNINLLLEMLLSSRQASAGGSTNQSNNASVVNDSESVRLARSWRTALDNARVRRSGRRTPPTFRR